MTPKRPEDAFIRLLRSAYNNARHDTIPSTRRLAVNTNVHPARRLSSLSARGASLRPSIELRGFNGPAGKLVRVRTQAYATGSVQHDRPREIAVLGGGITGLTTAHYLARHAKNAHITIYEASDKLGGWVEAKHVKIDEGGRGDVLVQHGPRMLRSGNTSNKYDDLVLYDVLANLNMEDKIRQPKGASEDRYLYYPDRLVKLPSSELSLDNAIGAIRSYLNDSIWDGALKSGINLWAKLSGMKADREPQHDPQKLLDEDESVGEFLSKLFEDDRPVKNLVSGMMHGIYGGDVYKLSAKHTMLDRLWYTYQLPTAPSLLWLVDKDWNLANDLVWGPNRIKMIELAEKAIQWKILAFEDGLVSLVDGFVKDLQKRDNVTIKYNEPVISLAHEAGQVSVTTNKTSEHPHKYDQVISTLFSKHLAQLAQPKDSLPSLAETHAVTIMVVNLCYPNPNLLSGNHGFGYLVPSSTPNNDEGALGVLFDSDLQTRDEPPSTKLTVMLGGHHWDGWEHLPSEEMGVQMAIQVVERHLGIDENEKVFTSARLCRDCLPQHFVGHRERMKKAHYELMSAFQGKVTVAGPSYTTVGVVPSMRAGFDAAMRVARGHGQPWFKAPEKPADPGAATPTIRDHVGETGLEGFTDPDIPTLRGALKYSLPFRKWTIAPYRYTDDEGQWVQANKQQPVHDLQDRGEHTGDNSPGKKGSGRQDKK